MRPLHEGQLTVEPSVFLGRLRLDFRGQSNDRDPGHFLRPYLTEAFHVVEQNGTALELHFEELSHFNSSTIAVVVQFIAIARMRNLSLTLVYDAQAKWQTISFDALKRAVQPMNELRQNQVFIVAAALPTATAPRVG
jgi:hypothetical protein